MNLDTDALAGLRRALVDLNPQAFAACFSRVGWLRVPRPDGDVVRNGRLEIEQIGHEIRELLTEVRWTPSQRFVTAGQVVEEAVAEARTRTGFGVFGEVRVSMRVVAELDPVGDIGSLTLWVDWAALNDPQGVDSARGAASALVAQARARDARGLRVIQSEPGSAAPPPAPPLIVPAQRVVTSTRPPGTVLWWRRHRATLAGSLMAVAAAAVIGWVSLGVLKPITDARALVPKAQPVPAPTTTPAAEKADPPKKPKLQATPTTDELRGAEGQPGPSEVPVVTRPAPRAEPKVQEGKQITLTSAVLFQSNSFELTRNAQAQLQDIADDVRKFRTSGNIQVNGYTDALGSTASNVVLSQRRADAVAEALAPKLKGLSVHVSPQAFGESTPIGSNLTAEGRQKNRRVTIVLPKRDD